MSNEIQIAINHLKVGNIHVPHINMAIESLEKQIPKEVDTETTNKDMSVTGEYDIESNMLCPICKACVGDYEADELYFNYCPECGQRLKEPQEYQE